LISLSGGREMFRLMVNLEDPADMLSNSRDEVSGAFHSSWLGQDLCRSGG